MQCWIGALNIRPGKRSVGLTTFCRSAKADDDLEEIATGPVLNDNGLWIETLATWAAAILTVAISALISGGFIIIFGNSQPES